MANGHVNGSLCVWECVYVDVCVWGRVFERVCGCVRVCGGVDVFLSA